MNLEIKTILVVLRVRIARDRSPDDEMASIDREIERVVASARAKQKGGQSPFVNPIHLN